MSFSIFRFSLCSCPTDTGGAGPGTESSPTALAGTPSLNHLALPARNGIYPLMNFATIRPHTLPQSSSQAPEDPQKAQSPTPEPFDVETRKVRWPLWISSPLPLFGAQEGKRGGAVCGTLLHPLHHFSLFPPPLQ